jgi:DNA-binding response OmpR family regulator
MKEKILLVDDKSDIGRVLSVYFSKDYELSYAPNPVEAIEWLQTNDAALIISDLRMPKMDGVEFLKYLKGNAMLKHIPVVILSAEDNSNERAYLLDPEGGGAVDFIVKPFNPTELKFRIYNTLHPKSAEASLQ